jgi:predicted nucleotidyltransferase
MNYTAVTLKVLEYLARDPSGAHHVREVAEKSRVSVGAASITLRALQGQRLAKAEEKGGSKFYSIDLSNPGAREFKILFNVLSLKNLVDSLKDHAERVVLFGSSADGMDEKDSDIDLYVLAQNRALVKEVLKRFQKRFVRTLSPIIVDALGEMRLRKGDRPLFDEISRGKVLWERE